MNEAALLEVAGATAPANPVRDKGDSSERSRFSDGALGCRGPGPRYSGGAEESI